MVYLDIPADPFWKQQLWIFLSWSKLTVLLFSIIIRLKSLWFSSVFCKLQGPDRQKCPLFLVVLSVCKFLILKSHCFQFSRHFPHRKISREPNKEFFCRNVLLHFRSIFFRPIDVNVGIAVVRPVTFSVNFGKPSIFVKNAFQELITN